MTIIKNANIHCLLDTDLTGKLGNKNKNIGEIKRYSRLSTGDENRLFILSVILKIAIELQNDYTGS